MSFVYTPIPHNPWKIHNTKWKIISLAINIAVFKKNNNFDEINFPILHIQNLIAYPKYTIYSHRFSYVLRDFHLNY